MSIYEHPFDLTVTIGVDPKPGMRVGGFGDRIFIVDERGERQNYDPRDVVQRINDLLRELTSRDDEITWKVRYVKSVDER